MCWMPASTVTQEQELADAVLTASRVLVAVAARSLAAHEGEISLQQYRALVVLASRGPQRPRDLALALGVDPSTATRLCDRLVQKHLISRRRQGQDRREVRLDLTPSGDELIASVTARRRAEIKRIVDAVPPGKRAALVDAFAAFGHAAGEVPDDQWQRSWDL
jgi:DNA-binding MarR family transcriptional regulator